MKKIIFLLIILFPLHVNAAEKKTTFTNEIFSKAQSDGKTVVVSSWIKYCTSCASQMKALKNVEKDFNNLVYYLLFLLCVEFSCRRKRRLSYTVPRDHRITSG